MGLKNKISPGHLYFLTMTVVEWIDVFTRLNHKLTIVDSLKFCQKHKGLEIYAWCLMSNHLHMIAAVKEDSDFTLSDVLRDFKKFTSKQIINNIQDEPESRRDWLLDKFAFEGRKDSKITNYKFWQDGNEAKEIHTHDFLMQKLNYIHNNPVKEMIVSEPQEYLFSSAIDYASGKGLVPVVLVD